MELTRDRFIEQFAIAFQVHCLRSWSTRFKSPPAHLATCFYERIKINGGRMSLSGADFARMAEPVIDAEHRGTPKGQRPDASRSEVLSAALLAHAYDLAALRHGKRAGVVLGSGRRRQTACLGKALGSGQL